MAAERIMREAQMSPSVMQWLESRGLEAHAEVSVRSGPVDVVAIDRQSGVLVAVEMKVVWSHRLLWRLRECLMWADEVWYACANGTSMKTRATLQEMGVGVFSTSRGVLLDVKAVSVAPSRWRDRAIDKLSRSVAGGVAGLPMLAGNGPRQKCKRMVMDYMRAHPNARSREVFAAIPNHYASFQSFSGVFGGMIRDIRKGKHECD